MPIFQNATKIKKLSHPLIQKSFEYVPPATYQFAKQVFRSNSLNTNKHMLNTTYPAINMPQSLDPIPHYSTLYPPLSYDHFTQELNAIPLHAENFRVDPFKCGQMNIPMQNNKFLTMQNFDRNTPQPDLCGVAVAHQLQTIAPIRKIKSLNAMSESLVAIKESVPISGVLAELGGFTNQKYATVPKVKSASELSNNFYKLIRCNSHNVNATPNFESVKYTKPKKDFERRKLFYIGENNVDKSSLSLDIVKNTDLEESERRPLKLLRCHRQVKPRHFSSKRTRTLDDERPLKNLPLDSTVYHSTESIGSITNDVHLAMLHEPHHINYLSDESANIKRQPSHQKLEKRWQSKELMEGTKHFVEAKRSKDCQSVVNRERKGATEVFQKCQSQSYSDSDRSVIESGSGSDEVTDEVFDSSDTKRKSRLKQRRSSSLDGSSSAVQSNSKTENNRSSVIINNKPEYYEYEKLSVTPISPVGSCASSSIANNASLFPNNAHGVALLRTSPKRGSLKKSSKSQKNTKSSSSSSKTNKSSDYDVRDRGRGRNGNGGRDSYRDSHHRSERDSDKNLSDREQRDSSHRGSFNRSLSNAEGTPEDKIGL